MKTNYDWCQDVEEEFASKMIKCLENTDLES